MWAAVSPSKGMPLEISVVKAQRIYDVIAGRSRGDQAGEYNACLRRAPQVLTLGGRRLNEGIALSGKVTDYRNGSAAPAINRRARHEACFYYRPYSGQVESLYAGEWKRRPGWRVEPMAPFTFNARELKKKLRQFEYRAVLNTGRWRSAERNDL